MRILQYLPYMLFQYGLFALFLGFPVFLASRWCLARKSQTLRTAFQVLAWAALAACALMCAYGILRLTGVVPRPRDHARTAMFYDTFWREEGIGVLTIYGSFLTGLAAALLQARQAPAKQ